MRTATPTAASAGRPEDGALLVALTKRRIKELDRLRDLGFKQIARLNDAADSMPRADVFDRMLGSKGQVMEYERLARAIRQIMVLEFELRGLFEAPDRNAPRRLRLVKSDRPDFDPPDYEDLLADLKEFDRLDSDEVRRDYRSGPLEDVVAGIRTVLGAAPPDDDPFAPPPVPAPVAPTPPVRLPHATVKLPEKPAKSESETRVPAQKLLALKAAARAIRATGGNGFRIPPKTAGAKKPRANRPNGRAPPR
jgi:hypothetical protein